MKDTRGNLVAISSQLEQALSRIRELEAQLAEARANLAKADNELNSAAYDLERQGRELADARLDSARLKTALQAAMLVLSGQETSKSMLVRALELGRLAMEEAK